MYKRSFKRTFDVVFSLLLLPIFALLYVSIGLMIKLEDQGPIFYNAKRLGKNGLIFKMYKFRSMKINAPDIRNEDGSTFNAEDDPRLTKIGIFIRKTSLDELPQILNVLTGDMSFIGPRPDLPEHYEMYKGNEARKLEVLPGITGYNQAYYRNSVEWKERIKHDIYYVDRITMWFDIKILFKTVLVVIGNDGVYIKDENQQKKCVDRKS